MENAVIMLKLVSVENFVISGWPDWIKMNLIFDAKTKTVNKLEITQIHVTDASDGYFDAKYNLSMCRALYSERKFYVRIDSGPAAVYIGFLSTKEYCARLVETKIYFRLDNASTRDYIYSQMLAMVPTNERG